MSSSSSHEEWSDEDVEGFLKRLLTAILVVGIGYYIFSPHRRHRLRRDNRQPPRPQPHNRNVPNGGVVRPPMAAATPVATATATAAVAPPNHRASSRTAHAQPTQEHTEDEEGIESFLKPHLRVPPHHLPIHQMAGLSGGRSSSSSTIRASSFNGVVPFRYTKASLLESSNKSRVTDDGDNGNGNDTILENRKDRARILARLFAARKIDPTPGKGKMLILSLSSSRIVQFDNFILPRVLYLLGTFYNVFVMVQCDGGHGDDNDNDDDDDKTQTMSHTDRDYSQDKQRCNSIISKLYSSGILTNDAIPSHRVVITKSVPSRIAFVRSFPVKPDYVIIESSSDGIGGDLDGGEVEDLQLQLTKFGYSVLRIKSLDTLLLSD